MNKIENIKRKKKRKEVPNVTCNCTKSNCRKKYCLCFKAGGYCKDTCRCIDCQNLKKRKLFKKTKISKTSKNYSSEGFSISICNGKYKFENK